MKKQEKKNKNSSNKKLSSKEIFNRARNSIRRPDQVFNLLDRNGITTIELKLPPKFFENILMGEMNLMESFSMKKLKKLMDLYTIAVEYYLDIDVERAKHYQNRMEYFITNKDILNNLSKHNKNSNKIIEEEDENEDESAQKRNRAATKGKLETAFLVQSDYVNQEILNKKVNSVLNKKSDNKIDKEDVKNIINNEISKQNEKWKEKLAKKKNLMHVNAFTRKLIQTPNPRREKAIFLSTKKECKVLRKNTGKVTLSELKNNDDDSSDYSADDTNLIKNLDIKQDDENSSSNMNDNISENSNEENKKKEEEKKNTIDLNTEETKVQSNDGSLLLKEKLAEAEEKKVDIDDNLLEIIKEKMKKIDDIEKLKDEKFDSESENEDNNNINTNEKNSSIEEIPPIFQQTYYDIEDKMNKYIKDFNEYFYKDIFYHFSSQLKDLYDSKYKKYIQVNNYYHTNIKQNEYLLEYEENLTEEKKQEYQSIINSLKEEQQDQIDKIEDEFNGVIQTKLNEFKRTAIKNNCGINLIEEQVKLDIYSLINDAFY